MSTKLVYYSLLLLILQSMLMGCARIPPQFVHFETLERDNKPHAYLVCPPNYCRSLTDMVSPRYPVDAQTLADTWQHYLLSEPRVSLLNEDTHTLSYHYVQYSRFFHFPDDIYLQFIPLTPDTSAVAIYSVARYGYYDFGVNKMRVLAWLAAIDKQIPPCQKECQ